MERRKKMCLQSYVKKKKINIHTWVWVVCTLIRTAMCLGSLSTEDKLEFSLEFGWEALS